MIICHMASFSERCLCRIDMLCVGVYEEVDTLLCVV